MSKINSTRSGCKDVFNAFLVEDVSKYFGDIEIPPISPTNEVPNKLILFSKALKCTDYDQWVCFYEDDTSFERIWRNPKKYLPILKKFNGVIAPDFSLYRDMPLVMQQWNTYRSRAIGHWLQSNGINVIANVRASDSRSHSFCCLGLEQGGTIAIGSHGCIKLRSDRLYFIDNLKFIVETLNPTTIVIYGRAPDEIFEFCKLRGINIVSFESDYAISRKAVV